MLWISAFSVSGSGVRRRPWEVGKGASWSRCRGWGVWCRLLRSVLRVQGVDIGQEHEETVEAGRCYSAFRVQGFDGRSRAAERGRRRACCPAFREWDLCFRVGFML